MRSTIWRLVRKQAWVGLLAFAAAGLLLAPRPAAAQTAPGNGATVILTKDGFDPSSVTIYAGSTVTWINTDQTTAHTVTQEAGWSYGLNSGGLTPNQCPPASLGPTPTPFACVTGKAFQFTFAQPGTYYYTSATDCLFGNGPTLFSCAPAVVNVVAAPQGLAPTPTPAPAQPAATATPLPVLNTAYVTLSDTGITPADVQVTAGGTVVWLNSGSKIHSATATSGGTFTFDTGGIAPGQTVSVVMPTPGRYTYTSYSDCIDKANGPGFQCGYFSVTVTSTPANAQSTPPPSPAPGATATSHPTVAPAANTTITIDDQQGFQPASLTVKVGQTVTWINRGSNVHSVVSNFQAPWYLPPAPLLFDSGGLGAGQQFSYTFTQPGTYNYHSSTEPVISNSTSTAGNNIITYQFNGVVIAAL